MKLPESVGGRIKAARIARGWTQDQLAGAVGVSRSAVAQWETDRAGQVRENLSRIAATLGVSVETLLSGEPTEVSVGIIGNELALLRLYRECAPEDQTMLLRLAHKLARGGAR
jgi:transcriptional regulator with XRE-family HTH domain